MEIVQEKGHNSGVLNVFLHFNLTSVCPELKDGQRVIGLNDYPAGFKFRFGLVFNYLPFLHFGMGMLTL